MSTSWVVTTSYDVTTLQSVGSEVTVVVADSSDEIIVTGVQGLPGPPGPAGPAGDASSIIAANISDSTAAGRAMLTAADAAAQRTLLSLGTAATTASSAYATAAQGAKADTALQPADKQTAISDFTPGRVALVDYIPRPTIDQIAGLAPTLDLDFATQTYRHYSPSTGLREKALSDIVTFTRTSSATYFDAKGVMQTAGSNVPRLDFDPVTGVCRGLLVEESRTNLFKYSQEFDNAGWPKVNATVTANAAVAPDGTSTACKQSENATGPSYVFQTVSVVSGSSYVFSVYLKAAELTRAAIQVFPSGALAFGITTFDLSSGTVFNNNLGAAGVQSIGSGWYRCWTTVTAIASGSTNVGVAVSGDQTIGFGFYLWGAQLEAGSFPTSYIPTTTAAATRAADQPVISGTTFSDFYTASNSLIASYSDTGVMSEQSKSLSTQIVLSSYIDGSGAIADDRIGALAFFPRELTAAQVTAIEGVI